MQNRMLGRAGFPVAPATSGRQADEASAVPVIFNNDRLDIRVCSINFVPCIALVWTHTGYA